MIDPGHPRLSIVRQCELASISRSSFYREPTAESEETLRLMRLIDEQFLETPWYGSRQMARHLRRQGWCVGRHRVRRLMTEIGLAPIYQHPEDERTAPAAQGLSVPAAPSDHRSAEPGLVCGCDLHPDAAGLPLPSCDHGLVQPQGSDVEIIEHDGCRLLRHGAGGGARPLRQT